MCIAFSNCVLSRRLIPFRSSLSRCSLSFPLESHNNEEESWEKRRVLSLTPPPNNVSALGKRFPYLRFPERPIRRLVAVEKLRRSVEPARSSSKFLLHDGIYPRETFYDG